MKKFLAFVPAVLLVAFVALAGADDVTVKSVKEPTLFTKGAKFGRQADAGKTLIFVGSGTLVYDFPALSGAGAAQDTLCAQSFSGTATGCAFGDVLTLGIDQTIVNAFGTVTPYLSAANTFVLNACAPGITDAGSFNMPDASYTVGCFRLQAP